jgi:membrane peptidoglycan carboxypeptidase
MSDVLPFDGVVPLAGSGTPSAPPKKAGRPRGITALLWLARLAALGLIATGGFLELKSSFFESFVLARLTAGAEFAVAAGPSPAVHFPTAGPYDERLGYSQIPSYIDSLGSRHFAIEQQARISPKLAELSSLGGYAIFREKARAGLTLLDRAGDPLYAATFPERVYDDYAAVPPILADTLVFVEDRDLLDPTFPHRNPAIDWRRFPLAVAGRLASGFDPRFKEGGASTLATQIEKFRHWPGGRTSGVEDKLRQMATATARSYVDGPDTTAARQRLVVTYLNSTPLSSRPGYGEVIGVPEGLWAWYGTDAGEAAEILRAPVTSQDGLRRKAEIYKQALSLILAERRPSYYLAQDRGALRQLTDRYLSLLQNGGIITPALGEAAREADLQFTTQAPLPAPQSFVARKAADALRTELLMALHAPNLYSVDRLDLTAESTLDGGVQRNVAEVLSRLGDPETVKSLGLVGRNLLNSEDPSKITYSVVLYERGGGGRNFVRVHADSGEQPFDVNSGAKLILGSTAKLRTLVTYLNIITGLRDKFGALPQSELQNLAANSGDVLTRWAAGYLAGTSNRELQPMLDAAMQRHYSGNPSEVFFTGGGDHVFHNFEKYEDHQVPSVEEAFENSVNLAFVRIMRDVTRYYMAEDADRARDLLSDRHAPERETYLRRFADQEGQEFLNHFYDDYRGKSAADQLTLVASRTRPVPRRLAAVFRSVRPDAPIAEMRDFIRLRLPGVELDPGTLQSLYKNYAVSRYSLADRGYLAGIHPLELWLVSYLAGHPNATRGEIAQAAADARQDSYAWLFKTPNKRAQDTRIRILLEEDAFNHVLVDWRKQGYAFGHLVPSLATAIGSSGDRPDALAELMGIILNDGVRQPATDLEKLRFAANTPYETDMAFEGKAPERVMAPEVAATIRRALRGVVMVGTGTRARDAFTAPDGNRIPVGGKTGTGDNRFDRYAPGGRLIESRAVDRTATFVFFIGDRFFGTVTAYVRGPEADRYHFTSALAVQLLKSLSPQLQPLFGTPPVRSAGVDGAAAKPVATSVQ